MRKADTIESKKLFRLILDYSAKIKDNLMLANVYRMVANGKGIGLNSVKSRDESMKGKIDIHSVIGTGTEINVEFKL